MHAQNCFLHAQIERTVIMEAVFFIRAVAWHRSHRARHGTLARIASASFSTEARRRGRHHSPRLLGAGAAGAAGAGAALLNSSPLLTRLLLGWSERRPDAP